MRLPARPFKWPRPPSAFTYQDRTIQFLGRLEPKLPIPKQQTPPGYGLKSSLGCLQLNGQLRHHLGMQLRRLVYD
jgi:hypothetical protein